MRARLFNRLAGLGVDIPSSIGSEINAAYLNIK
jgi:hypothetical protein